jgi:hypothetical protein
MNENLNLVYLKAKEIITPFQPDIILSDFYSPAGQKVADDLGVPCVVNSPAPLDFGALSLTLPSSETSFNLFGMLITRPSFINTLVSSVMHFLVPDFAQVFANNSRRVMILNTFWGLEKPKMIPPNLNLTGPLTLP